MTTLQGPRALDPGLDRAIMSIATGLIRDGWDVGEHAPSTYEALCDLLDHGGRMVVSGEGCEGTIYGSPEVNHAFRAWHDMCHWVYKHDFSLQGETDALMRQLEHLRAWCNFGDVPDCRFRYWCDILTAEVVGQGRYFHRHGTFPTDQRTFVVAYMADPDKALADTF